MKIDFINEGMTIHFDKVPRLLYYNEQGKGCGAIFIDGQRKNPLVSVNLQSKTRDEHENPLFYSIITVNNETHTTDTKECGKPYYAVAVEQEKAP